MQTSSPNRKFEIRKQLASSDKPISRLKIAVLGDLGVGKTTFIESLKCGFLKSFLWSSYYTISKATKAPRGKVIHLVNYLNCPFIPCNLTSIWWSFTYFHIQNPSISLQLIRKELTSRTPTYQVNKCDIFQLIQVMTLYVDTSNIFYDYLHI